MTEQERLRDALLGLVPDDPVWIEARAILLDPESRLWGEPDGYLVRSDRQRLAAIGGLPSEELIREALGDIRDAGADPARLWAAVMPGGFTPEARGALSGWRDDVATIFREGDDRAISRRAIAADVRPIRAREELRLDALPEELGAELAEALERLEMVATWVEDRPVAFCYVACETETLWDVSIYTVPESRRRGLAADCVAFLAASMQERGKRAVWGAHSHNTASRNLASKLGFEPWGRLCLFENSAGGEGSGADA